MNSSHAPLTSYGTQKAICELLLADYSRRGFFDGLGLRFPTICVRPGKPNLAASGFFSGIIREPLSGKEAILPVGEDVRHWHASPRAAIGFLLHATNLDTAKRSATAATSRCPAFPAPLANRSRHSAGSPETRWRASSAANPMRPIQKIVAGWPRNFEAKRALNWVSGSETSFDDIIRIHIEDELSGKIGA